MANCSAENAQYGNEAECLDYCNNAASWDVGTNGDTAGNSIACRIYHGNAPAAGDPALHCEHAGPTGGDVCGSWCDNYCDLMLDNCSAEFVNLASCQASCDLFPATGEAGDIEYDTVQCRIYHAGAPAAANPTTHCDHTGVTPNAFCVGQPTDFNFRTDLPGAYTRVDRLGMPAVSTALLTDKDGYNDGNPADDAAGTFVADITANLTGLHGALDDDLTGFGLTPCLIGDCVAQAAPLVVPDTLKIDPSQDPGFPNGRQLTDTVMDITLAVILLDLNVHGAGDLVGVLNPTQNDLGTEGAFQAGFPYLWPPHAP
jgi:hypothetical protein